MEKPHTLESVIPLSGHYSFKQDLRLSRWLLVATVVQISALFLLRHHADWPRFTRAFVALAPGLPGAFYIRDWTRFVRGMDELQRRVQVEVLLFATLGALLIGAVVSTFNASGIPILGFQHGLGLGGTFMATFILWLVGIPLFNCRYK
jgi:hypothetical protein